ncbi:MAG: hypothetical protein JXQ30_11830, partial [Spirochaetes bacterium]|nr:hypothetical protein [Spirochaetota bacterium]
FKDSRSHLDAGVNIVKNDVPHLNVEHLYFKDSRSHLDAGVNIVKNDVPHLNGEHLYFKDSRSHLDAGVNIVKNDVPHLNGVYRAASGRSIVRTNAHGRWILRTAGIRTDLTSDMLQSACFHSKLLYERRW